MVDAISSASSLNSKRCERPQLAFKGEQAPVDMEQKPDTFEKENEVTQTTEEKQGMSIGKKVAIGVGSLLALVAAGFGIKKGLDIKTANKALKEAAHAVGIEDVNLYKQLKSMFGKVSKHDGEKLEIQDILAKIDKLNEKGLIKDGDKYTIFPPKMTQEVFAKEHPDISVPKNAIAVMIQRADGKKLVGRELILNNGLGESLTAYPQDKLIVIPIEA
jgi:hypothetical protein